ncbi:MAG: hypothetical protein ABFD08_14320 [Syntrophomonas sp.]
MQLQNGEKSILAYFRSDTQANQALNILKEKGYDEAQLDWVSNYSNSRGNNTNGPSAATLSTLVFGNSVYDGSPSPLLAADPDVSGMEDHQDFPASAAYLLTVVTSEDKVQEALQILREHGANV